MRMLKDQYIASLREYLTSLNKDELATLFDICDRITEVQYEYDLNTDAEVDAALADPRHALPYPDPGEWLTFDGFLSMVFEIGAAAGLETTRD